MAFEKAVRKKTKLKIALVGPAGSGKTFSALRLAKGMGSKIAFIDTERGSASLYSDLCEFDVNEMNEGFTPEHYIDAIKEAVKIGYEVLIIDSLTHEWTATKEIAAKAGEALKSDFGGWGKANPRHRALMDTILQAPIHIISTMRAKTEWTYNVDEKTGKRKPVKLGMGPDHKQGIEYEFSTIFNLQADTHIAEVDKDRTGLFVGFADLLTEQAGARLITWIESGAEAPKEEMASAENKKYIFVLLNELGMKYDDAAVKNRLQEITSKTSMQFWTMNDLEKAKKHLESAIKQKTKDKIIQKKETA